MATLVLTAVGSAIGSALLPSGVTLLGTTITGAAIGGAIGGAVGSAVDQRIFGPGAQVRQGPRLTSLDVVTSTEGAPVPRVFGRLRIAGQVIWATRFSETRTTETQSGGKGSGGGVSTTTYSYSVSFAIGLCEGPITGISRLWADGKPLDIEGLTWRLHRGTPDQPPDPLIAALNTDPPAFRDLAYIVFEDLPLAAFGNRVPQITIEVRRAPDPPEAFRDGPSLPGLIEGLAMSPGSGEFALATQPVRQILGEGVYQGENLNNTLGQPDFLAALDAMEDTVPDCGSVLLIASWFGNDLRLGTCTLRPGVDQPEKSTEPLDWRCSGETRETAHQISTGPDGSASYGGTPSDVSVVQAIAELKRRGFEVVFYPFILMDISSGNPLGQPPFPWRGRIASEADGSAQAAADVAGFFGTAAAQDFAGWDGDTIPYTGPAESGLRRMILHYAHLCAAAGGVDSFIIGSELRSLTRTRDAGAGYPAVEALRTLAADVRGILGPQTRLSYAADWSEYANHRPADGSGDVIFHLDPLWSDTNIDFIAIDNYLPLADWRTGHDHLDAQNAESVYDLGYLDANVEGGEYADWFYASDADRLAQTRTPLEDTAHGEDWVFGVKRLRDWWSNAHHDRPGGQRSAVPTGWIPQSKPIRFTETGCPAVDLGANQPNVFHDPKSSESAYPHFSRGVRDDAMQRRYLQAMLSHWQGDPMIEDIHVWTWDARPYPDFPLRRSVWTDGANYEKGHWLTGRLDAAPLAEIVAEICVASGEGRIDVTRLHDLVDGFMIDRTMSAREALQPLMLTFGFDAVESDGVIRFVPRGDPPVATLTESDLVAAGDAPPFSLTRAQETDLPRAVRIGHIRADGDYRRASAEATYEPTVSKRVEETEQAIALTGAQAGAAALRWLSESHVARDGATFVLPPSRLALEVTDVIALDNGALRPHRIARTNDAEAREITATRVDANIYLGTDVQPDIAEPPPPPLVVPVLAEFLDLPLLRGDESPVSPHVASFASPWPGAVAVFRSDSGSDFREALVLETPATLGRTLSLLPESAPWRWSGTSVDVELSGGAMLSRDRLDVLAGRNAIALATASSDWEILQFRSAELIEGRRYRLSRLLRGQAGTEHLIKDVPPDTRFVLLDTALEQLPLTETDLNREAVYRYGPATRGFDDETYRSATLAFRGVGLRPYAPVHLRASVLDNGDLSVSWTRRSRRAADGWEAEPPIAEEAERYLVRVLSGAAELRRFESGTSSALYTAAEQAEDGVSPPFEIRIAQISAIYGPGPGASLALPN